MVQAIIDTLNNIALQLLALYKYIMSELGPIITLLQLFN